MIAIYSQNYVQGAHQYTLWEKFDVKNFEAGGAYINHLSLKG
jgi:hypothetical protein